MGYVVLKVGILAATALAVFGYEPVFYQLNRVGILPDRFSGYVAGASFIHFSLNPILVRLPFFCWYSSSTGIMQKTGEIAVK